MALLGWSISPDNDVFSMQELADNFDIRNVKANPAHFDLNKAIALNAEHIRQLEPQDFLNRSVPYLFRDHVVSADSWDKLTPREQQVLSDSVELVQPRVRLLGEVSGMVGSLLSEEPYIAPEPDAIKQLKDESDDVLAKAADALEGVEEGQWKAQSLHDLLDAELIEKAGYKPRKAYGPVRVAVSGRRVSPPLFESMEILGKDLTVARLRSLREHLGELKG